MDTKNIMRTKTFLKFGIIILFLLIIQQSFAQIDPNLKRKVLFTLDKNERIYEMEYFAMATLNGYKFAAIVENTATHEFTFVFNGKRITKIKNNLNEYEYVGKNQGNRIKIIH